MNRGIPLSSPHTHTPYCDGKSTAAEMVASALAHGFVSVGISSHAVQTFDPQYCIREDQEQLYIDEVCALQREYAGRIRVWLGTERDLYSIADRRKYEYVLSSVHYLFHGEDKVTVDGDPQEQLDGIRKHYGGDGARMAVDYYERFGRYIRDYRPDIIGHFDLVMKNNRQGQLFDPLSPAVWHAARQAMDNAIQGCDMMELNTGAMARSGAKVPYPSPEILRYWRSLGGRVMLSSDCHYAPQIAVGYEEGLQLMREAGYAETWYLGTGDELFQSAPL